MRYLLCVAVVGDPPDRPTAAKGGRIYMVAVEMGPSLRSPPPMQFVRSFPRYSLTPKGGRGGRWGIHSFFSGKQASGGRLFLLLLCRWEGPARGVEEEEGEIPLFLSLLLPYVLPSLHRPSPTETTTRPFLGGGDRGCLLLSFLFGPRGDRAPRP